MGYYAQLTHYLRNIIYVIGQMQMSIWTSTIVYVRPKSIYGNSTIYLLYIVCF